MRSEWIDTQSFTKYSGEWTMKVRKQFINGFELFNWVPEVWIGDKLVINGNGYYAKTAIEGMMQAEKLLVAFLDSSYQSLT